MLVGDGQPEPARKLARLGLAALAERKAQDIELGLGGREQEVALVALRLGGAVERAATARQPPARHIMTGRHDAGAEVAGRVEQVAELDRLVAVDARHRRLAGDVAVRETIDHRRLEAALVIEDVMRNADAIGDRAGIVDVLTGAARTLAVRSRRRGRKAAA